MSALPSSTSLAALPTRALQRAPVPGLFLPSRYSTTGKTFVTASYRSAARSPSASCPHRKLLANIGVFRFTGFLAGRSALWGRHHEGHHPARHPGQRDRCASAVFPSSPPSTPRLLAGCLRCPPCQARLRPHCDFRVRGPGQARRSRRASEGASWRPAIFMRTSTVDLKQGWRTFVDPEMVF